MRRYHFAQSYIQHIIFCTLFAGLICINSLSALPHEIPTRIILLHLRALQHRRNLAHITAGDEHPFMKSTGREFHASI